MGRLIVGTVVAILVARWMRSGNAPMKLIVRRAPGLRLDGSEPDHTTLEQPGYRGVVFRSARGFRQNA